MPRPGKEEDGTQQQRLRKAAVSPGEERPRLEKQASPNARTFMRQLRLELVSEGLSPWKCGLATLARPGGIAALKR
jgi:hypothetical protein